MAIDQFVTLEVFNEEVAAVELGSALNEGAIEYTIENTSASFDPFFTNNELAKEFRVKIRQEDFERADALLQQISERELHTVAKDYYLYEFTDHELIDVVSKKDEWGRLNFLLAQKY